MKSQQHEFNKSIYDMELHEELIAESQEEALSPGGTVFKCLPLQVLRVDNGWIYYNPYVSNEGVFVPDTRSPYPTWGAK